MGQPRAAVSPDVLVRMQCAVADALWHYTATPVAKPYYVRGCIPDPKGPRVTVALWTGPAADEKRNLFLSIPLVFDGVPFSATHVTPGLLRLGRGPHMFGFTGHLFDGKRVLDGSALVRGVAAAPPPGESDERHGPGASTSSDPDG
ncbi:hypothetical protein GCM10010277_83140 [Streptomyces longisporoflavus]|uniref:hypothetical protein n=1 Tax=Streptomyces longisporoflavus TaxID=28044 RepID=UPI0019BD2F66|nr:hypothetical protein [Streptomyces longisporoflavus]GGV71345.1 hypothetical protein GCM10010277_83140 [Streptomyces longisporoflavus]